jgi:hypothetical protein
VRKSRGRTTEQRQQAMRVNDHRWRHHHNNDVSPHHGTCSFETKSKSWFGSFSSRLQESSNQITTQTIKNHQGASQQQFAQCPKYGLATPQESMQS